jgi:DNA mismatch repair protein MutS
MAGMPPALIARANEILLLLENKQGAGEGDILLPTQSSMAKQVKQLRAPQMQLSIFDAHTQTFETIRKLLTELDINRLTPVEAMMKLNEIKNMIQ